MTGYTPAEKFSYWLFKDRIPLTKILLLCNVASFFAIALLRFDIIAYYLSFVSDSFLSRPWTALTYPFVYASGGPIGLLFSGYWLWMVGGSLERSWSTRGFAIFFLSITAISAVALFTGVTILAILGMATSVVLLNAWLPLAALTVAFAMLNPELQVMFLFIIPLKLKYLAMISAALVLIQYALVNPLLGLLSLLGCAYAYWYVVKPRSYSPPRRKAEVIRVIPKRSIWRRLNPFAWIKEWNDRRRLKKLFGDSDFRE